MKIIKGATIYTMNEQNEVIENGDVRINDGTIAEIGENLSTEGATEVIDGTGQVLTPGLIDAHTHVGLWSDAHETSHPSRPLMDDVDAIHPHDQAFVDARAGGATTVQTGAGSANPIGGVWTVVKTTGNTVEDMIIRKRSGLKGATGENAKNRYGQVAGKDP